MDEAILRFRFFIHGSCSFDDDANHIFFLPCIAVNALASVVIGWDDVCRRIDDEMRNYRVQ